MPYHKDMEKFLITGASGQLGHALQLAFGGEEGNAMPLAREALDIADTEQVLRTVAATKPDVVINCAAYTNTSQAEKDREQCWRANALGVDNLARACVENEIPLVHISTDFVFGQDFARCNGRPADPTPASAEALRNQFLYTEECPVGPIGFYAQTKAAGEHALLTRAAANPEFTYYIIRTAGLFEKPWRQVRNFPFAVTRKLLKDGGEPVEVIGDVFTNICYVDHLVAALTWMVKNRNEWSSQVGPVVAPGIYHIANRGAASWFEVAQRIAYNMGCRGLVRATTREQYATKWGLPPHSTPSFTCLDLGKYHDSFGPAMPDWTVAVDDWCTQAKKYFSK
jgi:dTDP-4-dehydrorhamnose reductase